jgi:DNA-binding CsgD family transcriptional regulator
VAPSRLKKLAQEGFSARMLGFAFSRAWVYVVFFNTALLLAANESLTVLNGIYLLSLVSLVVTLAAGGLANTTCLNLIRKPYGRLLPVLFSVAGTSFIPFANVNNGLGLDFLILAAVFTGIGSGLFMLFWGKIYSQTGGPVTAAECSLAFILAALLVPLFTVAPFAVQITLITLLPIASTVIMIQELSKDADSCEQAAHGPEGDAAASNGANGSPKTGACAAPAPAPVPAPAPAATDTPADGNTATEGTPWTLSTVGLSQTKIMLKLTTSSLIFGCIVTLMRSMYTPPPSLTEAAPQLMGINLVVPVAAAAAGGIVLCVLLFSSRLDLAFTYRPVLLLMILSCVLLPFVKTEYSLAFTLAMCGYICFEIMNWTMLSDITYRFEQPPFRVFGLGRAAVSGGVLVGAVVGELFGAVFISNQDFIYAVSATMIFVMVATYTFALTERDVAKITRQRARFFVSAQAPAAEEKPVLLPYDKAMILADEHEITGRNLEVLLLLVKGRSAARIEQELYMSRGTVNTHMRRIYQKLGVHSRQELLDLIDDVS